MKEYSSPPYRLPTKTVSCGAKARKGPTGHIRITVGVKYLYSEFIFICEVIDRSNQKCS